MGNSWLLVYIDEEFGTPKRLILLMIILRTKKHNVRPIMDYCELNTCVDTFTGAVDVCTEKL